MNACVRSVAAITCLMAAIPLASGCRTPDDAIAVKVVAHRGASSERPENTMAAYQRALDLGADLVEVDVRTSRDGVLFLLHDRTLERVTEADGVASDLTWSELQKLDAGSWSDAAWSGEKIPALHEVLSWAASRGATLLLDLKEDGSDYTMRVADAVEAAGMQSGVVIGVRSPQQAVEFGRYLPASVVLGFIPTPDDIESFVAAGADVIRLWLHWLDADATLAQRIRDTGAKLMVNGTDGRPEEAERLMRHRPDWILIDDVGQLRSSLEDTNRSPAKRR